MFCSDRVAGSWLRGGFALMLGLFGALGLVLGSVLPAQATQGVGSQLFSSSAGSISGRVLDSSGDPLEEVNVTAYFENGGDFAGMAFTDAFGNYKIDSLSNGAYVIRFSPSGSGQVAQYYADSSAIDGATIVNVSGGAATLGIDATLASSATISGKVLGPDGDGTSDAMVLLSLIHI